MKTEQLRDIDYLSSLKEKEDLQRKTDALIRKMKDDKDVENHLFVKKQKKKMHLKLAAVQIVDLLNTLNHELTDEDIKNVTLLKTLLGYSLESFIDKISIDEKILYSDEADFNTDDSKLLFWKMNRLKDEDRDRVDIQSGMPIYTKESFSKIIALANDIINQ